LRDERQSSSFFVGRDLALATARYARESKIIVESLGINLAVLAHTAIRWRNVCLKSAYILGSKPIG
jgi:hypothetical protein